MSAMIVPKGWEIKRLGELVDIVGGGTPARDIEEYWKKGSIPWVTVKDLHQKLEISDSEERITEFGLKNSAANLIPPQNIITPTRMSLGRFFINSVHITINQDLKALKPKKTIFPLFLLWNLLQYGTKLEALGTGTTVKGITLPDLKNLQLPVPSFPEQQKIATILSTLDRTIEATEKLINKEKMVKKGLMADLLTHGIDEQGRIRSPQTHTYVNSPLGMIPEGWEVKALGELGEFKNGINKSKEEFGFGVPFVNLQDIFGKWSISSNHFGLVNADENEIKNYNLVSGDVLFVRSSVKASGVGLTALVGEDMYSTVYSGFVIRFRSKPNIYATSFKQYCFHEELFRQRLLQKATVSANSNINQESLASLLVSLPSVAEQQKIASILSAQDRKIETEETNLAKLQKLKKGLMGDLLSGDVRVKG